MGMQQMMHHGADENAILQRHEPLKFQRNFVDGDFESVRIVSTVFSVYKCGF